MTSTRTRSASPSRRSAREIFANRKSSRPSFAAWPAISSSSISVGLSRQESLTEIAEAERPHHSAPNQLEAVLQKEKAAIVRQVINELPTDRDRQVLFRYYIVEDEKEQICADLGLTSLHFNRVLHRARERYKELYERAVSRMERATGD